MRHAVIDRRASQAAPVRFLLGFRLRLPVRQTACCSAPRRRSLSGHTGARRSSVDPGGARAPWRTLPLAAFVRHVRQIQSCVGYTRNRFSKPMAIACGHFLGAVAPVNTLLRMAKERSAYVTSNSSKAKGVGEVVPE